MKNRYKSFNSCHYTIIEYLLVVHTWCYFWYVSHACAKCMTTSITYTGYREMYNNGPKLYITKLISMLFINIVLKQQCLVK